MKIRLLSATLAILLALGTYTRLAADTLSIYSPAMDRILPAAVVLPQSYHESDTHYPVVYLLHGATGNYSNWLNLFPGNKNLLQQLADRHQLIFVMPDGDPFGFYADSPRNPRSQFETHISTEVVNYIDQHYRTIASAEGRAITGLSMGGHGALHIAIRRPGIFGAAGSMSGATSLDIKSWDLPAETLEGFSQQVNQALSDGNEDITEWLKQFSLTQSMEAFQLNPIPLIIDCGTEDFFLNINRELRRKLLEAGVKHDYIERPGAHNWAYWERALPYQVLFFEEFFRKRVD